MSVTSRAMVTAKNVHVALYRRFRSPLVRTIKGMPILLLTVRGRKSGTPMTTPVVYLRRGTTYVVAGSNGGAKPEPQWFKNLRAASSATIEVDELRTDVAVHEATGDEYDRLWAELVATAPFFEGYRNRSGRRIPLAVLTPAG